jgi:DNA segregation ATPase FtsK/SpoIIIE, S-DNA-T family
MNDLYEDAVKLVRLRDYCVVSMLQRQFRIGYTHAMQLVAQLEKNGVLAPLSGGRRKVLNGSKRKT